MWHVEMATQVAAAAASGGILDLVNQKIQELGAVLKGGALVAAIAFVVLQAIMSRGAMARIIISGFAAAVFVWIVFNVTSLQDRVDQEINGSTSLSSVTP